MLTTPNPDDRDKMKRSDLDEQIAALHQEFLLLQSENQKLELKAKLEGEIRQLKRHNEQLELKSHNEQFDEGTS